MHLSIRGCALALTLSLAACGGGGDGGGGGTPTTPTTPTAPATGTVTVRLGGASFTPGDVTIAPGATIRWVNDAAVSHTITPNNAGQAGAWPDQSVSAAGESYSHTFQATGDYPYHCNIHAGMTGTVRVRTP